MQNASLQATRCTTYRLTGCLFLMLLSLTARAQTHPNGTLPTDSLQSADKSQAARAEPRSAGGPQLPSTGEPSTTMDLRRWHQAGPARSGTWSVGTDGSSVTQAVNGAPTYYLSPDEFIDVTITGKIEILDQVDDDFIGLVLGYRSSSAGNALEQFLLFDWRGATQSSAEEGFTLTRVKGPVSSSAGIGTPWWRHSHPSMEVLASAYGPGKGWAFGTEYDFEVSYRRDRVRIRIGGEWIFDEPGTFESGAFGLYNFSQANVRYSALRRAPGATLAQQGHRGDSARELRNPDSLRSHR